MLNHLLKSENTRELKIILCISAGYLAHYLLYSEECGQYVLFTSGCGYYSNYSAGFFKSFVYLILCCWAAQITLSYRILGLCVLVALSMFIDLAFVVLPQWYDALSFLRYRAQINFKDLYTTYEAACILLSVCYWIVSHADRRNDSDSDDPTDGDIDSDSDRNH